MEIKVQTKFEINETAIWVEFDEEYGEAKVKQVAIADLAVVSFWVGQFKIQYNVMWEGGMAYSVDEKSLYKTASEATQDIESFFKKNFKNYGK
jgi:hypothetical protein